jgi:hypothetical protein
VWVRGGGQFASLSKCQFVKGRTAFVLRMETNNSTGREVWTVELGQVFHEDMVKTQEKSELLLGGPCRP